MGKFKERFSVKRDYLIVTAYLTEMKKILLLILLSVNFLFSQEPAEKKPILTEKENAEWISEFKKIDSTENKLRAIKKKVFDDRIFNVAEGNCFNIVNYDSPYYREEQLLYECKIAFALKIGEVFYFLDIVQNPKTFKILSQVKTKYIADIKVLDGDFGSALALAYFGSSNCGMAVIIKSKSKKLKRNIKNAL